MSSKNYVKDSIIFILLIKSEKSIMKVNKQFNCEEKNEINVKIVYLKNATCLLLFLFYAEYI
jgi:hypothetical protein